MRPVKKTDLTLKDPLSAHAKVAYARTKTPTTLIAKTYTKSSVTPKSITTSTPSQNYKAPTKKKDETTLEKAEPARVKYQKVQSPIIAIIENSIVEEP